MRDGTGRINSPASSLCVGTTLRYVYIEGPQETRAPIVHRGDPRIRVSCYTFPTPSQCFWDHLSDDPLEPNSLSQGLLLGELPQRTWPDWDACRVNGACEGQITQGLVDHGRKLGLYSKRGEPLKSLSRGGVLHDPVCNLKISLGCDVWSGLDGSRSRSGGPVRSCLQQFR